jgi:hypothetical protein
MESDREVLPVEQETTGTQDDGPIIGDDPGDEDDYKAERTVVLTINLF